MGYNNPAFVDDDNKSSVDTRTTIRHDDKQQQQQTNDIVHETTVNRSENCTMSNVNAIALSLI